MQKYNATTATPGARFSINDAVGDLFQTAVLLLGDEQAAASVVEQVVADADPCPELGPEANLRSGAGLEASRRPAHEGNASVVDFECGPDFDSKTNEVMDQIVTASLARICKESAGVLDAPCEGNAPEVCIQNDDLTDSGISSAELQSLMEGPGRAKLRQWLEQLSPCLRAAFVLRAILGRNNERTATMLLKSGARGWSPNHVSPVYRQALCSLATSLVKSTHSPVSA